MKTEIFNKILHLSTRFLVNAQGVLPLFTYWLVYTFAGEEGFAQYVLFPGAGVRSIIGLKFEFFCYKILETIWRY